MHNYLLGLEVKSLAWTIIYYLFLASASSKGSGETVRMRRFVRVIAAAKCISTNISWASLICWLGWLIK